MMSTDDKIAKAYGKAASAGNFTNENLAELFEVILELVGTDDGYEKAFLKEAKLIHDRTESAPNGGPRVWGNGTGTELTLLVESYLRHVGVVAVKSSNFDAEMHRVVSEVVKAHLAISRPGGRTNSNAHNLYHALLSAFKREEPIYKSQISMLEKLERESSSSSRDGYEAKWGATAIHELMLFAPAYLKELGVDADTWGVVKDKKAATTALPVSSVPMAGKAAIVTAFTQLLGLQGRVIDDSFQKVWQQVLRVAPVALEPVKGKVAEMYMSGYDALAVWAKVNERSLLVAYEAALTEIGEAL